MPGLYSGVGDCFKSINASEGLKGFTLGWLPTLLGYSAQGFGKFGFYEIFKDVYAAAAGENAAKYKVIGWSISSACAEFIADILLCPWEAVSNLHSLFKFSRKTVSYTHLTLPTKRIV